MYSSSLRARSTVSHARWLVFLLQFPSRCFVPGAKKLSGRRHHRQQHSILFYWNFSPNNTATKTTNPNNGNKSGIAEAQSSIFKFRIQAWRRPMPELKRRIKSTRSKRISKVFYLNSFCWCNFGASHIESPSRTMFALDFIATVETDIVYYLYRHSLEPPPPDGTRDAWKRRQIAFHTFRGTWSTFGVGVCVCVARQKRQEREMNR